MNMLNPRPVLLVLGALPAAAADTAASDGTFSANVTYPSTHVAAQPELKRRIVLPDLEYTLQIDTQCSNDATASALFISVADTRLHPVLPAATEDAELAVSLSVPGVQIAPLLTEGFCVTDLEESYSPLLVEDLLTAQLSLQCRSDSGDSIHYLSQPLALQLLCDYAGDESLQDSSIDK